MIKNEEVRKTLEQLEFNHSKFTKREMVEKICKTISYVEDLEYRLQEAENKLLGLVEMRQEVELKNMNTYSSQQNLDRIDDLIKQGFNVEYDYKLDILTAWKGEKIINESIGK